MQFTRIALDILKRQSYARTLKIVVYVRSVSSIALPVWRNTKFTEVGGKLAKCERSPAAPNEAGQLT